MKALRFFRRLWRVGCRFVSSSPRVKTDGLRFWLQHAVERCVEARKKKKRLAQEPNALGGEGGIRTLGTLACTTVFETAPFNHSGTSPAVRIADAVEQRIASIRRADLAVQRLLFEDHLNCWRRICCAASIHTAAVYCCFYHRSHLIHNETHG